MLKEKINFHTEYLGKTLPNVWYPLFNTDI